jgi:hypothetical protein
MAVIGAEGREMPRILNPLSRGIDTLPMDPPATDGGIAPPAIIEGQHLMRRQAFDMTLRTALKRRQTD